MISAIRKVDPYHMVMGARFVGKPIDAVLKAAAEWNDVISINSYPSTSERNGPPMSRIAAIYNATNKPIIIGEFAYKANVPLDLLSSSSRGGVVYLTSPIPTPNDHRTLDFRTPREQASR
jgi:hypothetical protein